ncbi:ZIP family metal transporter [Flagellimonas nanhaiensis]|uniref:ZIP family metal transporter n=1 Tax=Flagellimonas nanhaiensis TaxID=2292706 RepID=A0A371JMA6_9FLAO|nr:ZIP family metal transporter [Allomuricauda nanhaiensis]RDY58279.1 ZIP family metal transporter [Allomuricauda nanhaiensis]
MNIPFAVVFIIPVLAVWASFGFAWAVKPKFNKNIRLLLAFSGAFLLALTFFELLPEVYEGENPKTMALFILAGILLQIFLEFFSKGAEHGHMHIDGEKNEFPILLFLSLSIHALVEGVPIEGNSPILYGIIVHKVPVAIILSIFLLNSKMRMASILLFISIFSLMTPLGTYVATYSSWVSEYGNYLNALAIGVFLHISTIILFESSQGHSFNFRKLIVILLGVGVAYFI